MLTRSRDRDAAMPTLEQHDAEMLLQLLDALTDTRLTDAERGRGAPDIEVVGHRKRFDERNKLNPRSQRRPREWARSSRGLGRIDHRALPVISARLLSSASYVTADAESEISGTIICLPDARLSLRDLSPLSSSQHQISRAVTRPIQRSAVPADVTP